MANKPNPIIFKITEAGRLAVLDAQKQGISLSLKTFVAGTSKYVPNGRETRIKTETMRSDIVTSGIENESKSLRFSVTLNSVTSKDIYEVGLLTSDNKLFAIAASTGPLFTVYANVTFVGSFGLSLGEIDVENITIEADPNSPIAVKMMEDHLAAADPHPQYIKLERLTQLDKKVDKLGQNINGAAGDLAGHLAHANPHPQYTLKKDSDQKTSQLEAANQALQKELDAQKGTLSQQGGNLTQQGKDIASLEDGLANHIKAADPHSQYAKKTDLSAHTSAADPHTQYAKKTDLSAHTSAEHPHTQYLRESDLAGMKQQIDELQKQLTVAQNKVTELPIGSLYVTTNDYKSGAEVKAALGYGTWARFAEGKTLVGMSTKAADPEWTKKLKTEFGEYDHKLTVAEIPSHTHDLNFVVSNIRGNTRPATQSTSASPSNLVASNVGGDKPHNNVQPSTVVAYWLRTA